MNWILKKRKKLSKELFEKETKEYEEEMKYVWGEFSKNWVLITFKMANEK